MRPGKGKWIISKKITDTVESDQGGHLDGVGRGGLSEGVMFTLKGDGWTTRRSQLSEEAGGDMLPPGQEQGLISVPGEGQI